MIMVIILHDYIQDIAHHVSKHKLQVLAFSIFQLMKSLFKIDFGLPQRFARGRSFVVEKETAPSENHMDE